MPKSSDYAKQRKDNIMGLNIAKGNMYDFVTHTWNTIKGACPHDCSYCYMKRWGTLKPVRFDEKELKTDLGEGNFIFVGSSCDIFAEFIDQYWVTSTLAKCSLYAGNKYLFQSKDVFGMSCFMGCMHPVNSVICTTIETNRIYRPIMGHAPSPENRAKYMQSFLAYKKYVTIEPIMDFDLEPMVELIKRCDPEQVNIGADSGNNHLPEPPLEKVMELLDRLSGFTTIAKKNNLQRLLNV